MAHDGNGQGTAQAEESDDGIKIPSLEPNASLRDLAAYMKAFKAGVANIKPPHKQRIAISIQKALASRDLTTDKLNDLLSDPTIHRTFSQPEAKLREMKKTNPTDDHAGVAVKGTGSTKSPSKRPRSRPTATGSPAAQPGRTNGPPAVHSGRNTGPPAVQPGHATAPAVAQPGRVAGPAAVQHGHVTVNVTMEEWNVLQNVPQQQQSAVLQALRMTPPQYLTQPGYHAYQQQQQQGVMSGYQYNPNVDPALYGMAAPPNPQQQGYMTGPPVMSPGPMTPRASPMPQGSHPNGHQMAHAGAYAHGHVQPARMQTSPPNQRVEPFAQRRPESASAVPQIVQAAPQQSHMQRQGHPHSIQGSPRQMLHNGHMAHPSMASASAHQNMMAPQMQRAPRHFMPPPGFSGAQGTNSPLLQSAATGPNEPQERAPRPLPEVASSKGKTPEFGLDAAYWDKNAPHWSIQQPGLDRNKWSGYLNPAAPQNAAPAKNIHERPVSGTHAGDADATKSDTVPSTQTNTAPSSVTDVDTAATSTIVESIEGETTDNAGQEKEDCAAASVEAEQEDVGDKPDEPELLHNASDINQHQESDGSPGPWDDGGLDELFPEYLQRYGATHTKDEIFMAVTEELMAEGASKEANSPASKAPLSAVTSQNNAPGTNKDQAENTIETENNFEEENILDDNAFLDENFGPSFDPALFDELFNENGDWIPDEDATAAVERNVTKEVAEDMTEMARIAAKAKTPAAAVGEQLGSASACSTPEARTTTATPVKNGAESHNLISDQANNVPEKEIVECTDQQRGKNKVETKEPCNCDQCGRSGTQSSCCLEILSRQHPDAWSFLQPMIRHNCVVYDRNALTGDTDLGKPVVALYPQLIGQSAEVRFGDEAMTVLQAPIMQLPEHLRFIPSMTVFQDGSSFANDPVGTAEYMYTGKVIADGPAGSKDDALATYRSYWGDTGARALIGRQEAEANKLISLHNECDEPGETAEQRASVAEKLGKRSLDAVRHTPGSGHSCGAGSNEYLVYNPRLLPKYVDDEQNDLIRAIEGANALNSLHEGVTPELISYIPGDLSDMNARSKIPFTIVVHLAHAPHIFDLILDAAHVRVDRGSFGQDYLPFGSKMIAILAVEMRRERLRSDTEVFSTLRRLVPNFHSLNFTEKDLVSWRMQLLRNEEYVEFYWIVRSIVRKDFRGPKLLRMIWESDARLFDTKRDDEMDTLGLTLTLEEMLRIAGQAIKEEEAARGKKRRAEDDAEPAAKRAKI